MEKRGRGARLRAKLSRGKSQEKIGSFSKLPSIGMLTCKVIRARNVASKDANGFSDPYAKVFVEPATICSLPKESLTQRSPIVKKSLSPVWNYVAQFPLTSLKGDLVLELYDWDRLTSDDFLGTVRIPLESFVGGKAEYGEDMVLSLLSRPKKPDSSIRGVVEMYVHFKKKVGKEEEGVKVDQALQHPKSVCMDDFDVLKLLGRGNFGKVVLVQKISSRKVYAMKILRKEMIIKKNEIMHTRTEKHVLQKCKHPFLVELRWSFQTKDKLFLVMEFVNGGELFTHLQKMHKGRLPEEQAKFYICEVILAIGYLHAQGVVYRDLKPENICIAADGHVKLTDFGLAKEGMNPTTTTSTFCGTAEYMAPDCNKKGKQILVERPYTKAVDWWAVGVLFYEMTVGCPPFYDSDVQKTYHCIKHGRLVLPSYLSRRAMEFIIALLVRDPRGRLGGPDGNVEEIKAHPYFDDVDWEALEKKKVRPPMIPDVSGPEDTRFFDEAFTRVDPRMTNAEPPKRKKEAEEAKKVVAEQQDKFMDFSYVDPSALGKSVASEAGFAIKGHKPGGLETLVEEEEDISEEEVPKKGNEPAVTPFF